MTIQEQIKDLDTRIEMQMDLINRYGKAGKFAPDFYLDELYQMCNKRTQLMRKMKMETK